VAKELQVDLAGIESQEQLHAGLAHWLAFPSWYGKNCDAFWDCINDPDLSHMPERLTVRGWNSLRKKLPRQAALLRRCLEDWCQEVPNARVDWVD
jgi:ribonuclease inhibitor